MPPTRVTKRRVENVLRYGTLAIATLVALFPIYWLFTCAFKDVRSLYAFPPKYVPFTDFEPKSSAFYLILGLEKAGETVMRGVPITVAYGNSFVVAACSSLLAVAIGVPAAYGLARFKYVRWKNESIAFFILAQKFLPPIAMVLPIFLIYKMLHLLDTHLGLIILHTAFNLPFVVWLMRAFIDELPRELEEAARIDGCSDFGALMRIVLPLSAPGLVVTAIFCFIFSWNELLMALILTYQKAVTLPIYISGLAFSSGLTFFSPSVFAIVSIAILPVIILSILIQRYIVKGLTFGAVKG